MVNDSSSRYLSNADGAPPVPPGGGYRGARRVDRPENVPLGRAPSSVTAPPEVKNNALGWIALVSAIGFAIALLAILALDKTDVFFHEAMIGAQIVLVLVLVGALFSQGARKLALGAVVVAMLFNVGTVGAASAVRAATANSYDGVRSEQQLKEQSFPGIRSENSREALRNPSLEEVQSQSETLLRQLRVALSTEYDLTWVESGTDGLRAERNGYGGQSMLQQYTSPSWTTREPIRGTDLKNEMRSTVDEVLAGAGMRRTFEFNTSTVLTPEVRQKLYGGITPETQWWWEWSSDNYPEKIRLYINIFDLSQDASGAGQAQRDAQHARTGEPAEGIQLQIIARELLSEDDAAEYQRLLDDEYSNY